MLTLESRCITGSGRSFGFRRMSNCLWLNKPKKMLSGFYWRILINTKNILPYILQDHPSFGRALRQLNKNNKKRLSSWEGLSFSSCSLVKVQSSCFCVSMMQLFQHVLYCIVGCSSIISPTPLERLCTGRIWVLLETPFIRYCCTNYITYLKPCLVKLN